MNLFLVIAILFLVFDNTTNANGKTDEQCTIANSVKCEDEREIDKSEKYKKASNELYDTINKSLIDYVPCSEHTDDNECLCHTDVISRDLAQYQKDGINRKMLEDSAKYGTRYKILNSRLYRDADCMFPARCTGIEYFILRLLPQLPNMDMIINTRDWPQLRAAFGTKGVVFSFSKTNEYYDVMYPAWTFWAGGPAISLHPTGIGRWDLLRESLAKAAKNMPWHEKQSLGFFRGSRTSDERDALVLLSRRKPELVDAQFTKNQGWKSSKDTLNAEAATEVSFEKHCQYKYLFNFRGVAASFRLKHLFLCKSLVFHVGDEWNEFFYFALKPWVHYVPLNSYPSEQELESILKFFREHDDLAQSIAARGYEFIWQHLRMQDVECYWKKLLIAYQALLQYNVVYDKNLIEIKAK